MHANRHPSARPPQPGRAPGPSGGLCRGSVGTDRDRGQAGERAFTLIELLLAMVIFAVVLSAISGVFYSAMRLRTHTADAIEAAEPAHHALAILRRDLAGIVLPSGLIQSNLLIGASSGDGAAQDVDMAIYTSSGQLGDLVPWGEILKVSYALRPGTNGIFSVGKDLVRLVTRNHLPPLQDEPEEQRLLAGVQRIDFTFYNGTAWQNTWNSTNEDLVLPKAVKVQLTLADDPSRGPMGSAGRPNRAPLELVVPILITASTNQTASTTGGTP